MLPSLCPPRHCWCIPHNSARMFTSRCTGAGKRLLLATGGLLQLIPTTANQLQLNTQEGLFLFCAQGLGGFLPRTREPNLHPRADPPCLLGGAWHKGGMLQDIIGSGGGSNSKNCIGTVFWGTLPEGQACRVQAGCLRAL